MGYKYTTIVGENIIGAPKMRPNFLKCQKCLFFQYCNSNIRPFSIALHLDTYRSFNFAIGVALNLFA